MNAQTSSACSAVAVLPVPIAHTGSYAMVTFFSSSSVTSHRSSLIWRATTSSVMLHSRSQSSSPTQTMGLRPAARAALVLLLTVSSVSPKYCLRSLCPSTTYSTPISLSIPVLISPVNAPDSAQWQFSAPILILVPCAASIAAARSTYGTHATTSHPASLTSGAISASSAFASEGVLFIFQLPAMIAFLISFFMV